MKINEIVQEGILDTLGRGIAQGLGVRVDSTNRDKELAKQAEISVRSQLPTQALTQFRQILSNSGINLDNPRTYDANQLAQYLKDYSKYFFVGNMREPMASYLIKQIDSLNVTNLTDAAVAQFFNIVNDARSQVVDQGVERLTKVPVQKQEPIQANPEPQQTSQSTEPFSIGGQRLDPNNPADAKIIAQLQKQQQSGQTTAPQSTTMSPEQVRQAKLRQAQQNIDKTPRQSPPMTPEQIRIAKQQAAQQAINKK